MARILIIDDSPTDVHVCGELLRNSGHEVISASSAEEGIEAAKREQPELILMDVIMPGMNGFQATRSISRDPATEHIPVIIISTKSMQTDRVWGMRQGAKEYVTKPIDADDLLTKISHLVGSA